MICRPFTDADKKLYDQTFKKCDEDKDGYVNGTEIKGVFLQVNVSASSSLHPVVIINLCFISSCHFSNSSRLQSYEQG